MLELAESGAGNDQIVLENRVSCRCRPTIRRNASPISRLPERSLAWEPTVPLREGLLRTIEWFRSIDMEQYRPPTPNF